MLHLRFNEPEIGTWVLRTEGDGAVVLAADEVVTADADHWLAREIRLFWRGRSSGSTCRPARSWRSSSPGSCFAGTLAELALAADRSFMLDGTMDAATTGRRRRCPDRRQRGWYAMANGLAGWRPASGADDDAVDGRGQPPPARSCSPPRPTGSAS